ncbi:sensor histidine kinase [Ktedonospora formicarum]|uniref:Sensor histidine kinase n=1 Tax=Ktedonospora formicarum TaxID=2778364 RepID=A0A8J3I210_9CHLR|nr:sensor histidine kinase [Ktedonospora formicarum]GHO47331.1 sensor histidine kinase [Ktedonospora formicarum]
MKFTKSLRMKLSVLYLLTTVIPLVVIVFAMPSYTEGVITQDTQTLTTATLTAVSRNIDTYLDDLDRLTLTPYLNSEVMYALKLKASNEYAHATPYQRLIADQALYSTLPNYLRITRKDILNTIILPLDGSVFVASKYPSSSPVPRYPFTKQEWYRKAIQADGDIVFVNPHSQDYLLTSTATQVFSVARLIKDPDSGLPLAVIMADADTVVLHDIVNGIKLNVSSIIAVFGTNGKLLYSSQPLSTNVENAIARRDPGTQGATDNYIPVIQSTASAQWKVVILLSQAEIIAKLRWLYITGIGFAIGAVCITLLVFFFLSRWIITPFQHMIVAMMQVQEGNLHTRFVTDGEDEIAQLGIAFNTMVARLNTLIEREYVATLNQRNAEYHALQAQIQPHFLYNTLNGFIGLNRLGERKTLESAIIALSGLLRYVLNSDEQVILKEEFLFVKRYCELQALRFQGRLTYHLQCEDGLADFILPKVLLQPLVENAMIHGIEPSDRPCHLNVCATSLSDEETGQPIIHILIEDDGVGFSTAAQSERCGLGLNNVRERLKMAFAAASLTINSQVSQGTRVTIKIPRGEAVRT